jgi:hypothetical protein
MDLSQIELKNLITHHVGNKMRDEGIRLSEEETIFEEESIEYLLRYFLSPFKPEEFYNLNHSVNMDMNEVYTVVQNIFASPKDFTEHSQSLAKLLYEYSVHPKIKEGELNIAYFKKAILEGVAVDAIGIFKSENDVPFIKMKGSKNKFSIKHEFGFELKGIDKGCLIFNYNEEEGYKLLITDTHSRSEEAQYWKNEFLKVKPVSNEFHQTNQFLGIAKNFVTKQLSEEFEISKADKIDLLNRSVEYFKSHDTFDKKDFEEEVFQDKGIIESFRTFDETYREANEVELADTFEISQQAVKKQAKVFKSVLKLDKNFHIYIHGNKQMIEQGTEPDGRKFYKIYYEHEA